MKRRSSYMEFLWHMIVLTMLGTIMFVSDLLMELLPNIHLVGALIIVYTLVYRVKALIPIYVYVFLNGIYAVISGTALWWIPYLYVWTVLWGMAMLIPRRLPPKIAVPIYIVVCALHGFLFGVLYAPGQALIFGLSWEKMLLWIAAGLPFDVLHGIGNAVAGGLIFPLSRTLMQLEKKFGNRERMAKITKE